MASKSAKAAYEKEFAEQRRMFHSRWASEVKDKMQADPWNFDYKTEIENRVKEFTADEKVIRGMFR